MAITRSKARRTLRKNCDSKIKTEATKKPVNEAKQEKKNPAQNYDNINETCPLRELKRFLHPSMIPEVLLNRENELSAIKKFILNGLKPQSTAISRVLYISGVPGTGKTASVLKVVKQLKNEKKKFNFLNVNGLELSEPKLLYVQLYRAVKKERVGANKKISPKEALQFLNDHFTNEEKKCNWPYCIVLIDEVDMIYTKREDVLYMVFDWAQYENSKLAIIAISNTLDLAERTYSQRIVSRMGGNKLVFQPYEFQQIEEILRNRIKESPAISDKTIELASKKIASISGDIRKVFQLMSHSIDLAIEKAENEDNKREVVILPEHVLEAINESISSIRMEFIAALSKHEELLFRALVLILYEYALEEATFITIMDRYKKLCSSEMIHSLPLLPAFEHLREVSFSHLVVISAEHGELHCKVKLGFPISEAQFCLRQLDSTRKKVEISSSPSCSTAKSPIKSPKRARSISHLPSRLSSLPNKISITSTRQPRRKLDFN